VPQHQPNRAKAEACRPRAHPRRRDAHCRRVRIDRGSSGKLYQVYSRDGQLLFGWDAASDRATNYVYLSGSLVARAETGQDSGLPPPESIGASPNPSTNGTYSLTWSQVSGAIRYELAEAGNGGAEQTVYSGADRSWQASGKANGEYTYRVRACSASICGNYSGTVTVKVESGIPSLAIAPNPSVTGTYTATWSAVAGATRYVLKETPAGGTERTAYDGPNTTWTSPSMRCVSR